MLLQNGPKLYYTAQNNIKLFLNSYKNLSNDSL